MGLRLQAGTPRTGMVLTYADYDDRLGLCGLGFGRLFFGFRP